MNVTRRLLKETFGADADVSLGLFGSYRVKMPTAGRVDIGWNGKMQNFRGGPEIYIPAMRLIRSLGYNSLTVSGNPGHIAAALMYGQAAGLDVGVKQKRWFGSGMQVPHPSGAHGSAGLATYEMLRKAGLVGVPWGHGLRLAEFDGELLRYARPSSVVLIGAARSGKQRDCITAALVEGKISFFVIDPKGELLAITKRARQQLGWVRWLVPYKEGLPESLAHYADETDSYNGLYFLDPKAESFVALCDAYAAILVSPDKSGEAKEGGFFTGNAQMVVSGIIMQLVENYRDQATVPEVASIALSNRIFEFSRTAMQSGSAHVKDRLATFASPDAPLLKGGLGDIQRTMREQLRWASDPAMARILKTPDKPWRFNQLKDELGTIYIGVSAKFSTIAHKLNRWLMGCCAMEMQSTPPGRFRACLVADEFPMMGKVEIFETMCAEGAGHGFTVWPIVQNSSQLIQTYGQEGYRNILSACEIQMFLTPRDPETASEIERLAGDKTLLTCSFSYGGRKRGDWDGMSIGEAGAKVLDAHSVMGLASDRMIIVAPGLVPDVIIAQRKPYWTYPDIDRWCDPNPYAPESAKQQTKTEPGQPAKQGDLVKRIARELEEAARKK